MKVIVVTCTSPFMFGGATLLVDWLEEALVRRGHDVETYRIPVWATPDALPAQLVGLRKWDFTGQADRLIAIRTPSYLVKHPDKVAWFLHHHRPSYDLWATHSDVPKDGAGREFRRMMFASDEVGLGECRAVFSNSQTMSDRLKYYNGIESSVLYPPLGESVVLRPGPLGESLVYVSRVVGHKRQLLAIEALAHTKTPVQLTIAGACADRGYSEQITRAIDRLGLAGRVRYLSTNISESTKAALLGEALGVVYVPLDEDSYGFVGLEAAASKKPLVTVSDSGGVLELVRHGVNGLIADPTPASLGEAFDRLYEDRDLAARLGDAQAEEVAALNISWDHVVESLLG